MATRCCISILQRANRFEKSAFLWCRQCYELCIFKGQEWVRFWLTLPAWTINVQSMVASPEQRREHLMLGMSDSAWGANWLKERRKLLDCVETELSIRCRGPIRLKINPPQGSWGTKGTAPSKPPIYKGAAYAEDPCTHQNIHPSVYWMWITVWHRYDCTTWVMALNWKQWHVIKPTKHLHVHCLWHWSC